MSDISRRGFLGGAAAAAVAAALPIPAPLPPMPPIFEGSIGIYRGIVLRSIEELDLRMQGPQFWARCDDGRIMVWPLQAEMHKWSVQADRSRAGGLWGAIRDGR